MDDLLTTIDGKEVKITNPGKLLWPELGVTKLDYITYLLGVAPYLLPYTKDRLLMRWRFPDGLQGERIEEKSIRNHAPDWVAGAFYKDKVWILLNDPDTLAWVANREALELQVALTLKEVLDSLGLFSVAKTSGAKGMQVHIPIKCRYTFEETRIINKFIAEYMLQKMPDQITLERLVKRRGDSCGRRERLPRLIPCGQDRREPCRRR